MNYHEWNKANWKTEAEEEEEEEEEEARTNHSACIFISCHRKYSQSDYRKAIVYSTILYQTVPSH